METTQENIEKLRRELGIRRRIYKAWISFLDHETGEALPFLEEYPVFYFELKQAGLGLDRETECRLVVVAQSMGEGSVSEKEIEIAKVAGLLDCLDPFFPDWVAIAWGRLACKERFSRFGVSSSEILGGLELDLVLGSHSGTLGTQDRRRIVSLLGNHCLEEIVLNGYATKAELFSFVSDLVKADVLVS